MRLSMLATNLHKSSLKEQQESTKTFSNDTRMKYNKKEKNKASTKHDVKNHRIGNLLEVKKHKKDEHLDRGCKVVVISAEPEPREYRIKKSTASTNINLNIQKAIESEKQNLRVSESQELRPLQYELKKSTARTIISAGRTQTSLNRSRCNPAALTKPVSKTKKDTMMPEVKIIQETQLFVGKTSFSVDTGNSARSDCALTPKQLTEGVTQLASTVTLTPEIDFAEHKRCVRNLAFRNQCAQAPRKWLKCESNHDDLSLPILTNSSIASGREKIAPLRNICERSGDVWATSTQKTGNNVHCVDILPEHHACAGIARFITPNDADVAELARELEKHRAASRQGCMQPACICFRTTRSAYCSTCKSNLIGRAYRNCSQHPNVGFTTDHFYCPFCCAPSCELVENKDRS